MIVMKKSDKDMNIIGNVFRYADNSEKEAEKYKEVSLSIQGEGTKVQNHEWRMVKWNDSSEYDVRSHFAYYEKDE